VDIAYVKTTRSGKELFGQVKGVMLAGAMRSKSKLQFEDGSDQEASDAEAKGSDADGEATGMVTKDLYTYVCTNWTIFE
jgi:hypothetical protein